MPCNFLAALLSLGYLKTSVGRWAPLLFHIFPSQEERKSFGGSDFIELQYCRLPWGAALWEIVLPDGIEHWKNDSLYVSGDDMDVFYRHYGPVMTGGVSHDQTSGPLDLLGINFYSREQAAGILRKIQTERPPDHQIFEDWLREGERYIGFYVLGV